MNSGKRRSQAAHKKISSKTMLRNYCCTLLSSSVLHFVLYPVQGTEIVWKGTSNDDDPAKSAPKSQRYWDEHNIERPDYAKTDAEIAAERGEILPSYAATAIVILLIAGLIYLFRERASGQRLGGSGIGVIGISSQTVLYTQQVDGERTREARLARFENHKEEPSKND